MVLRPHDGGESIVVQTEFDGVYYMPGVPLGRYELGPDSDQMKSVNLYAEPATRTVEIANIAEAVTTIDFDLRRIAEPHVTLTAQITPVHHRSNDDTALADSDAREQPPFAAAHSSATQVEYSENKPKQYRAGELDGDLDGVADFNDRCGNSSRGDAVNRYGCVYLGGELPSAGFNSGSAIVTTDLAFALNGVVRELNANPSLNVSIRTHGAGPDSALTKRRVRSVTQYLVEQGNISPARLKDGAVDISASRERHITASGGVDAIIVE
jgi:outer membrane protein OmpA-like peptidoglycan-associated protein